MNDERQRLALESIDFRLTSIERLFASYLLYVAETAIAGIELAEAPQDEDRRFRVMRDLRGSADDLANAASKELP